MRDIAAQLQCQPLDDFAAPYPPGRVKRPKICLVTRSMSAKLTHISRRPGSISFASDTLAVPAVTGKAQLAAAPMHQARRDSVGGERGKLSSPAI